MNRFTIVAFALMSTLAVVNAAGAQQFYPPAPGASRFDPPVPVPPGPKITVPVVPKMDELPNRNYVTAPTRPSFGERFSACLDAGAAAGLGPNARAAYAGGCANRD